MLVVTGEHRDITTLQNATTALPTTFREGWQLVDGWKTAQGQLLPRTSSGADKLIACKLPGWLAGEQSLMLPSHRKLITFSCQPPPVHHHALSHTPYKLLHTYCMRRASYFSRPRAIVHFPLRSTAHILYSVDLGELFLVPSSRALLAQKSAQTINRTA